MSGGVIIDGLEVTTGPITDNTKFNGLQPTDEGGLRRWKEFPAPDVKTYMQGTIPAEVAQNTSDIAQNTSNISQNVVDIGVNTAYKDRVKTKVLWAGPEATVLTPRTLDGGENFENWDYVIIYFCMYSDTQINFGIKSQIYFPPGGLGLGTTIRELDSSGGRIEFQRISDTSFQISTKTASAANISYIIGIKL